MLQQHHPPVYTIDQENIVFCVTMLDELVHTDEHPFCLDPECPCKEDATLNRMFIHKPLDAGLLTNAEAIRLYFGTQLVPTQDTAITDEEIEAIMNGDADNREADELDQDTHDWLSEHL